MPPDYKIRRAIPSDANEMSRLLWGAYTGLNHWPIICPNVEGGNWTAAHAELCLLHSECPDSVVVVAEDTSTRDLLAVAYGSVLAEGRPGIKGTVAVTGLNEAENKKMDNADFKTTSIKKYGMVFCKCLFIRFDRHLAESKDACPPSLSPLRDLDLPETRHLTLCCASSKTRVWRREGHNVIPYRILRKPETQHYCHRRGR